jgi:hypothetical protein
MANIGVGAAHFHATFPSFFNVFFFFDKRKAMSRPQI